MFTRLRQPGGAIGGLSLAAAVTLFVLGVVGFVSLVIAAAAGSDFWSDQRSNQIIGAAFFAIMVAGAAGFVVMDRQPWPGAALAVLGSLSFGLILWWAILPLVLGLVFAVVAVLRARRFHDPTATAMGHPTR
jgi:uncharacterized membrane protein YhaH (DUF805 family)